MTSLSDALLVGYAVARDHVDTQAGSLEEGARVRVAAELAIDCLLPCLPPARRQEIAAERETAIEWLVGRVAADNAITDPAKAN